MNASATNNKKKLVPKILPAAGRPPLQKRGEVPVTRKAHDSVHPIHHQHHHHYHHGPSRRDLLRLAATVPEVSHVDRTRS